jgi:phage FluMu protein Com
MAADFITCPSCEATLRPKVPLAAGTRIKCPKCMNVFTVPDAEEEAPAPRPRPTGVKSKPAPKREEPEEEVAEEGEILDDEPEDEEPEEDRPRRKKKKKKPSKKKGTPLWVWLTAGAGVFLLLCCAGCAGFIWYGYSTVANIGSGQATFLHYLQIQKGMSEAEVKTIMGPSPLPPGPPGNTSTMTWQSGADKITVDFVNGKVVNRSCHLTNKSGAVIDQSGFQGQ